MVYIDPSALRALYVHDPRSRALAAWRSRLRAPLKVTRFGFAELINAVALGNFRGDYDRDTMNRSLQHVDDDIANGDLRLADLLWRAALDRTAELSRQHTASLGTRTLDVLHVASALELNARLFVTYDARRARLAQASGLKTLSP